MMSLLFAEKTLKFLRGDTICFFLQTTLSLHLRAPDFSLAWLPKGSVAEELLGFTCAGGDNLGDGAGARWDEGPQRLPGALWLRPAQQFC